VWSISDGLRSWIGTFGLSFASPKEISEDKVGFESTVAAEAKLWDEACVAFKRSASGYANTKRARMASV
jgi:hypothetical protein